MDAPSEGFKRPLTNGPQKNKLTSVPESGSGADENMLTMYNVSWVGPAAARDSLLGATAVRGNNNRLGETAARGRPKVGSNGEGNSLLRAATASDGKAHYDFYSGALGDPSAVSSQADLRPAAAKDSSQNSPGLLHLSYLCPGLHDRNSRQDIGRRTVRQVLTSRLVIPLFQRRYCWREDVVTKWFEDVRSGTRDHLGIHNTGNVVVKYAEQEGGYILIDGQQRVTTSLLLLAAIRDTALQVGAEDEKGKHMAADLTADINNWLFVKSSTTGHSESRLLPCLMDRPAYMSIIRPPHVENAAASDHLPSSEVVQIPLSNDEAQIEKSPIPPSNEEAPSLQMGTYKVFMACLKRELRTVKEDTKKLETLRIILNQSLDKMGVTLVDILTPVDLAQVFLWLQEKSLMGMAALLKNDRPGVRFAATDLVRNLLMSPFMDRTLEEQEEVYKTYWQEALEMKFASAAAFSAAVESYIKSQHRTANKPSQFEEAVASFSQTMQNLKDVETYAMFVTIYESRREERGDRSLVEVSLQLLDSMSTFLFNQTATTTP